MFAKVQKPSLVMTIPICLCVQQGKGGKLLSICEFHSLTWYLQQYLEMYHRLQCAHSHTARPHWHREKCATVGCDILRQICNAARKWPWGQMKWRGCYDELEHPFISFVLSPFPYNVTRHPKKAGAPTSINNYKQNLWDCRECSMTYECLIQDLCKNSVPDKATNYQNPPQWFVVMHLQSHWPQTYNWLKQGLSTQEAWWLHLRVGTLALKC
jgi:hypothetical protein